jgi:hypothetical protein
MREREVFRLIVRVTGFGCFFLGALGGAHLLILAFGLPTASTSTASAAQSATSAGTYLILGLILLAAANLVTRVVYGDGVDGARTASGSEEGLCQDGCR